MKKHWIYIKRGLSEDPKHRAAMGECIWLYMHIIDRADWETGIAYDWKDKEEAAEMSMPVDTLRYQRQKLEEMDYIRCRKKQYSQDISIMEWRNPRDYGSEIKNPRIQSSNELPLSNSQSLNQSLNQSSNQLPGQIETPTSTSLPRSSSEREKADAQIFQALEQLIGSLSTDTPRYVDMWCEKHSLEWILKAVQVAKDKGARSVKYIDQILIGWEANGYPKTREQQVQDAKKGALNANRKPNHAAGSEPIPEDDAAAIAIAAQIKAERAAARV